MNRLGIRAHDLGKDTALGIAAKAKAFGFEGVQLVLKKALVEEIDLANHPQRLIAFDDVSIMMLGSYFNPVHPDLALRQEGIDQFKAHLRIAKQWNVRYVGTETGSTLGSPWNYTPENHTEAALECVIDIVKDLVDTAEKSGAVVAIEGAYAHVAYSPRRIKTILDRVPSSALAVIVDLFNFLTVENHERRMAILEECFALFGEAIVIFHLKDYRVENGRLVQVGLGQGLMDYRQILAKIKLHSPNAFLIFEGVTGADIATSVAHIRALL